MSLRQCIGWPLKGKGGESDTLEDKWSPEKDKQRWKEKREILGLAVPENLLWIYGYASAAALHPGNVNVLMPPEFWMWERRHVAEGTTTTRPAFQTQHWKWWWKSHMHSQLIYHKHTYSARSGLMCLECSFQSITLVCTVRPTFVLLIFTYKRIFKNVNRVCLSIPSRTGWWYFKFPVILLSGDSLPLQERFTQLKLSPVPQPKQLLVCTTYRHAPGLFVFIFLFLAV